jgi:IS4 transposase
MFETTDLGLAAALCVSGFSLEKTERTEKGRYSFYFKNNSEQFEVDVVVKHYWANKLDVDALTYYQEIKKIKAMIMSQKSKE